MGRGVGSVYLEEYLKILESAVEVMRRFPLIEMTAEERKTVVLSYVELVDQFQEQLEAAGVSGLLDLYTGSR